jgi:hypothetical protein
MRKNPGYGETKAKNLADFADYSGCNGRFAPREPLFGLELRSA